MSKTIVVMKREFLEFVQTRTFLIATLLGPLLIAGFIAMEVFILTRTGGGDYTLTVVDQSGANIGERFAGTLPGIASSVPIGKPTSYKTQLITEPNNVRQVTDSLEKRIQADSLDGYLMIPAGILEGERASYHGRNATSQTVTNTLRSALQMTVQSTRLTAQGIDPTRVAGALKPVQLDAEKTGGKGVSGSAEGGQMIGFLMAFAIYLVVLLYGAAIMNGVLEEKRDKIVEVIVSSLRARDLMIGKVLGIGGAGLLQMGIWVLTAGLVLAYAGSIATILNLGPDKARAFSALAQMLPTVPLSIGIIFLLFFAGGFFIYSTLYATIGSIATTNQEAQQLVFPAMMPIMIGFFMSMLAVENPDAGMSVAGSLIPFTSPLVMPIRAVGGSATTWEIALSLFLLLVTGFAILWASAKIYRIGIFATGKRPTFAELGRWLRAS
jgi:ABC-2 type transport system permease protein